MIRVVATGHEKANGIDVPRGAGYNLRFINRNGEMDRPQVSNETTIFRNRGVDGADIYAMQDAGCSGTGLSRGKDRKQIELQLGGGEGRPRGNAAGGCHGRARDVQLTKQPPRPSIRGKCHV
jgi:hypothetical protein